MKIWKGTPPPSTGSTHIQAEREGRVFACKLVDTNKEGIDRYLQREVDTLHYHSDAPFIVGSVETFINSDSGPRYTGNMWEKSVTHGHKNPFTGWLVIVMDFVDGVTLQELIETYTLNGKPIPHTMSIVEQSIRALSDLHSASVVHRDLKPDNIMADHTPYTERRAQLSIEEPPTADTNVLLPRIEDGAEIPRRSETTHVTFLDLGLARRIEEGEGVLGNGARVGECTQMECDTLRSSGSAKGTQLVLPTSLGYTCLLESSIDSVGGPVSISPNYCCAPGAPLYNAPECWSFPFVAGPPSDIWALGLVFSQMLMKDWVLSGNPSVVELRTRLQADCGIITEEHTSVPGLPEMINSMLQEDPSKRPTGGELVRQCATIKDQMVAAYLTRLDSRIECVDTEYMRLTGEHCPSFERAIRTGYCFDSSTDSDYDSDTDSTDPTSEEECTFGRCVDSAYASLEAWKESIEAAGATLQIGWNIPMSDTERREQCASHLAALDFEVKALVYEYGVLESHYVRRFRATQDDLPSRDWRTRVTNYVEAVEEFRSGRKVEESALMNLTLDDLVEPLRVDGFSALVTYMESVAAEKKGIFSEVEHINLSGNAITTRGLAEGRLARLLRCCPNVECLSLFQNSLLLPGLDSVAQEICSHGRLEVVRYDTGNRSGHTSVLHNATTSTGGNPFDEAGFFCGHY
ncbi:hypothetical protein KIPB_003834 [Kipferlia bialata]|uniref:non-specific serine/threonine protein kinase n=1 Tax=Kipferlia bialata TaxID=797122 RepID=A0A9K3GHQ9_9EUKA|nr:hypothetical protein KIPB_003834 [Kipferlia bialata]|eukprot:g3834.t1